MTPQKAIEFIENEVQIDVRYCSDEKLNKTEEVFMLAKSALEKQIPKKPYKTKEPISQKQNDYYCSVCKRYLGDDMELKYACLQPEYCQHCGQALDWSDT